MFAIFVPLSAAAVFAVAGIVKVVRIPAMRQEADHLGFSQRAYQLIGVAEIGGAAGLALGTAWAPVGVAAAVALLGLLAGAVVCLRRAGDGPKRMIPALWVGALTAAAGALLARQL